MEITSAAAMRIRRLRVQNFKSFSELDIELGGFNVLVGANASGKSNLVHVIEFLRDVAESGLGNAVSMQGDVEFLRNVGVGTDQNTKIEFDAEVDVGIMHREELFEVRAKEISYSLELSYEEDGFSVEQDRSEVRADFYRLAHENGEYEEDSKIGTSKLIMVNEGGGINFKWSLDGDVSKEDVPALPFFLEEGEFPEVSDREALLEQPFFGQPFYHIRRGLIGISIYEFDTKAQKKAAPISGKTEIEEDGSNVALVLKNLIEDKEQRRKLINLLRDILPFVEDIGIDRFAGRSLIVKLKESHLSDYLPASLLSDGTVKMVALLIALYFENKQIIAFEEPDDNLHPHLISRLVEMMEEQSQNKQIFVTTHNAEMIKHADIGDLYLVFRGENGFSQISKPGEKKEIQIFLENEMGIEDLFVQRLLEI